MPVTIKTKGSFKNSRKFLKFISDWKIEKKLHAYGKKGVEALADATPTDSGKTRESWSYTVKVEKGSAEICWTNENVNDGVNIAVILQYGHATGTGGYVQGIDYINPAIKPIFEEIARDLWEEVVEK